MTREEAIRILDPETTIEALAEIEYYAGFSGPTAKVQAVDAACVIAVSDMRAMQELVTNRSQLNYLESDAINRVKSDTVKGVEIDQFKNEPLTLDDLRRVWGEVEDLSDSIAKGYCTVSDLREILKLEEGVCLTP